MTTTKNNANVTAAIAILGLFNRFSVDDGNRRFSCSGINLLPNDFVEFQKQAATPEYSRAAIVDASADYFQMTLKAADGTAYRIMEAHDKSLDKSAEHADNLQALIDWDRSGADGDMVRIVLDLGQHRRLTAAQDYAIKSWINRNFGGQPIKYQVPRTIYFERDSDGAVYAGIYSLQDEKPISSGLCLQCAALMAALDAVAAA